MNEECLICKAPLEYLNEAVPMTCALCQKEELSKTRCVNGHYICNDCHTKGMDAILAYCLTATSTDPVAILEAMMAMPFCHMHGPEHHVMVGVALLTAYANAGGSVDLDQALPELYRRGREVPGGVCGFWGACGAGISTGIYLSVITGATPLSGKSWGLSNQMTARALEKIGQNGGPRCCKRDSYLAVLEAARFTEEHLGIALTPSAPVCTRSGQNNQCIQKACPFYAG